MFLRSLLVAAAALMLSGCTGWWSETRLIPVSARDQAGLAGTYVNDGERVTFAPAAQGLVRATDPAGEQSPSEIAFALLRDEPLAPSDFEEATPEMGDGEADTPTPVPLPDRGYLMEIPFTGEEGKTAYTYAIARIGFAGDGSADRIEVFSVLCSKASQAFAARKKQKACIFDDYDRLRAAALDALAWQDDARMPIDSTVWQSESLAEADAAAPAGP